MIINILVCKADGTQELEQREVVDDWFDTAETGLSEAAQSEAAE